MTQALTDMYTSTCTRIMKAVYLREENSFSDGTREMQHSMPIQNRWEVITLGNLKWTVYKKIWDLKFVPFISKHSGPSFDGSLDFLCTNLACSCLMHTQGFLDFSVKICTYSTVVTSHLSPATSRDPSSLQPTASTAHSMCVCRCVCVCVLTCLSFNDVS